MLSILIPFVAVLGLILYTTEQVESFGLSLSLDHLAVSLSAAGAPFSTALRRRGRPRKFEAPSRAVTLTLPENVINRLAALNPDLSRAIVGLAKQKLPTNGRLPAELTVFGRRAVISVRPTASLEQRAGIELVPLPDGRALISFDQPMSIADLELVLKDAVDDATLADDDRNVFEGIIAILTEARRSDDVSLLKRSIIVIESARRARKTAAKPVRRGMG